MNLDRLRALWPYLRRRRGRLALGVGAIFASAAFGLLTPSIIGRAIDAFVAEASGRTLVLYAVALVAVTALQGVGSFTQRTVLVTLSRDVENTMRDELFAHFERMPRAWYEDRAVGDLMARSTNDLQAVRMIFGPAIMYGTNTLFTGLGALAFMASIHAPLTLVPIATMPLVAMATKVVGGRTHALVERVQEEFSRLTVKVQESLAGVRVVRAYAREASEQEAFDTLAISYLERSRRLIRWTAASGPLLQLLVGVSFVVVLWLGGRLTASGELTVGQFVAFNFYLAKLVWPMIAIGWVINLTQRASASFGRVLELVRSEPEIRDAERPTPLATVRGALAFRGLTYRYDEDGPPALDEVDLEIAAGETVAVVGRTGSGKSTLLATVPRILDPPPGTVLLDGVDVRELELGQLRGAIGVVPQEPFLFSATLAENVRFGRPSATPEAVEAAVRRAGLAGDVERFPRGLETRVGERGITLSGGQKQRLALARALVRDPRMLLLDDCLSAVDTGTEEEILAGLEEVVSDRTVLLVSHRISTARRADRIVVLEAGRVAAVGTHRELLAGGGLYAELDRRQRLEEELAAV